MRTNEKKTGIAARHHGRDRPASGSKPAASGSGGWPTLTGCRSRRWRRRCPAWPARASSSGWARACTTGRGRRRSGRAGPTRLRSGPCPCAGKGVFPAGIAAANLLGFTTQNPARVELATDGLSLPRLIVGKETVVHTRRPESWRTLSETDAALLDFLRNRGASSELSPEETVDKLLGYFREPGRFERLLKVAPSEPPRVRAMLGAIGQQLGQPAEPAGGVAEEFEPPLPV